MVNMEQIHKARSHPLRAELLRRLGSRVCSPGVLARELDAPLGVVSYHVRMLRDYGMVELVRTEPRRGALEHFYRAVERREPIKPEEAGRRVAELFGVDDGFVQMGVSIDAEGTHYDLRVTVPS